ncbi:MAG: FMN-binding protein [Candidatus Omnitrophica bacterium]|nr:FMN-binding protein [Candidatus Omnitrophota bacterium]
MLKSNYLKYAATLAIICLAASGLLSVVFNLTQPKIIYQKMLEEQASLKEVLPQAANFEPVKEGEDIIYYNAKDAGGNIIGYAFKASKKGYSSDIVTMVGVDTDGVISHIKILSQNETPGLGTRISEVIQKETLWDIVLKKVKLGLPPAPWFQGQFDGKRAEALKGSVNVITGATVSSRAVIDSIENKAKEIMEKVKHGQ